MFINIVQNTSLVENVNKSIISKLYELMTGTENPSEDDLLETGSSIVGSLNTDYIYDHQYNYITSKYNDLHINYRDTYLYIADPYVKRVLLENNFGDDTGVFTSITKSATTLPKFGGNNNAYNTEMVSFDELKYFTNVTSLSNNPFQFIGDQFLSVDIRNVTNIQSAFYHCGIHQVKNSGNITSLNNQVFELANNLEELDVSNVKSLGFQSITNSKLTELHFNDENDITFSERACLANNKLLTTITGLRGTTSFGAHTIFAGCSALTELQLDSLTGHIPTSLVEGCTSLHTFYAPNAGNPSVNTSAFNTCKLLENLTLDFTNIQTIGERAFISCEKLNFPSEFLLNNSITTIGKEAFKNNLELSGHFNLSNLTITTISMGTFYHCSKLDYITLNDNIKLISWSAFDNCINLKAVYGFTSGTLVDFDGSVFNYCINLESISGIKPKSIKDSTFQNCLKLELDLSECISIRGNNSCLNTGNTSLDLTKLESLEGGWTFSKCSKLTSVKWSDTLNTTSQYMFSVCPLLTTITNVNALKTIKNNTFNDSGLTDILNLPNVEKIEEYAFKSCKLLTGIRIPNIKYLGKSAFYGNTLFYNLDANDLKNVEEWYAEVFNGCNITTITSLTLNNIKKMSYNCFAGFNNLTTIIINVDTCFSLYGTDDNPFGNNSNITNIYIKDDIWDDMIQLNFYVNGNATFKSKFHKLSEMSTS